MKASFRTLLAGLGTAMLLVACGGGGGGDDRVAVTPPRATISTTQTSPVEVGTTVTYSSAVSSKNGSSYTYAWTLVAKPAGSHAALSGTGDATTSFIADASGDYKVSLTVNDGKATSSAVEAVTTAVTTVPVANAGADINTLPGTVQLDGTASQPPDGGDATALQYQWTLTSTPAGSTAKLDDATVVSPRFTADLAGDYQASLVVSYDDKTSKSAAQVAIHVVQANVPAVIAATVNGTDATAGTISVDRNTLVTLDASGSYDPDTPTDKSKLQYRWSLSGTTANTATLSSTTTATTSFTPNAVGSYSVTLQVFDGVSLSTKSFFVNVKKPAGEGNLAPKVLSPLVPSGTDTYEAELGAPFRLVGSGAATDEDYNYPYPTYVWTWISYPAGWDPSVSFNDTKANTSTFTPTIAGDYTVELQVYDAGGAYSNTVRQTYTALLGANRAPTANAKTTTGNNTTLVGHTVTLDGSASSDPDTNKLTYEWTLVDRPDGSTAALDKTDTANPTLTPDKAGPYTVKLVVTDSHGWRSDTYNGTTPTGGIVKILAKTENHAPYVRMTTSPAFTQEQPLLVNKVAQITNDNALTGWSETADAYAYANLASNAYDPDGDALTYLWTMTEEPAGDTLNYNTANGNVCSNGFNYTNAYGAANNLKWLDYLAQVLAYRTWNCASLGLAPSKTGRYSLQLAVYDGSVTAGPYNVSFYVATRADYPSPLLENINKQTMWSNADQQFELMDYAQPGSAAPAGYTAQLLFPYDSTTGVGYANVITSSGSSLASSFTSGDFVVRTFRLTAGGSDYTITNLQATDVEGKYQPKFVGLADGQVIRKGTSVDFQLVWPIPAPLEVDANGSPVKKDGLVWSFGIKEKPSFTFKFAPTTSAF